MELYHYIKTTNALSAEVDKDLLEVSLLNKYGVTDMDEVHVKNDLVYDKHQGCLIDFTNLEYQQQIVSIHNCKYVASI